MDLPHRDRSQAGAELFREDAAVEDYCRRFATLSDLYRGEGEALQAKVVAMARARGSARAIIPAVFMGGTVSLALSDTSLHLFPEPLRSRGT